MSQFAKNLKTIRKTNKKSQIELSRHLGYGNTAISNYESGRNEPSIDDLIKIADYFGVTVDYLVGIEEDQKKGKGLNCDEAELLNQYRRLSNDGRESMIQLLRLLERQNI